ncbi:ribosome maturation factor RimP [Thermosulfidibacter takaii ABI70S6]|uniref:Ribosome maturation factor RimP n=1 Tax=Thermosulfidibacter takaii (strain DSM 17441 / JCM 13301 / NBRC 103674 / ABI70S6) TaxID=1298851 RepID=A0A0S3QRF8_THET7|nr:ribosome maturation factor RimP [Thermosulfidibacter takaii]BAT70910.1 ribosome maturation factor RimP [Thermosulfidibacter takaii ABI70S6]
MDRREIEERVEKLLEPILKDLGLSLYDVEWLSSGRHNYLRVFIDKPGGVTVGDCERVSQEIGDILDVEDFIHVSYYLEVSSPGLTRELKKPRHYLKSIGELVKVVLKEPVAGRKELEGIIKDADEDGFILFLEEADEWIPYEIVAKAKLLFR